MSLRRLEKLALAQLRAECARLVIENDALRARADAAEDAADAWREEAHDSYFQLLDATDGQPGITQQGHRVIIHEAAHA